MLFITTREDHMIARRSQLAAGACLLVVVCGIGFVPPTANAEVLSASIVALPELTPLTWGDGLHDLWQRWSVQDPTRSGWFYGSGTGASNADVYVFRGLADPTTVTDAERFDYTDFVDSAQEGDTVFFRGKNGYYGAWVIQSVDPLQGGPPVATLQGQWFFQDDGSGCFAADCNLISVEPARWGSLKALFR